MKCIDFLKKFDIILGVLCMEMAVSDRRVVFSNSTKNTVYAGMAELADAQDSGTNTRDTGSGGRSIPQNPSKIKGFRAFPLDLKSLKKRSKTSMSTKCLPNF